MTGASPQRASLLSVPKGRMGRPAGSRWMIFLRVDLLS